MKPRLSRATLESMLDALAVDSPFAPTQSTPGAMCYMPCPPLEYQEYRCPVCRGITRYSSRGYTSEDIPDVRRADIAIDEVPAWRRLVKELRRCGVDISFNEKALCIHCHPDATEFVVSATLKFPDVPEVLSFEDDAIDELAPLLAVVQGKIAYKDADDSTSPLSEHVSKLREMIGLKSKNT
jgi:hypothetical protein